MNPDHIRVQSEAPADIAVNVRMGVDHPRQHQPPADICNFLGAGRQNVLLNGRDLAVADRDIHHAIEPGGGTNDVSTAE